MNTRVAQSLSTKLESVKTNGYSTTVLHYSLSIAPVDLMPFLKFYLLNAITYFKNAQNKIKWVCRISQKSLYANVLITVLRATVKKKYTAFDYKA